MPIALRGALCALVLMPALAAVPPPTYAADDPASGATHLMLVLDSSGSMKEKAAGGTKIQAARKALLQVIKGLPPEAPVGMRVFGSKVFSRTDAGACEDTQLVVPAGTDNREELTAAATAYKPYGETPIPAALKAAAADLGSDGDRAMVLVSDGESTCGDPCPVARQVAKSGVDLTINVVGLAVSGKARAQLKCIADAGGGTYYDADSAADIESTLEHVASRTLHPFTITGAPVQGGTEENPTPVTVGDWSDEFPAGATDRYYSFTRTAPGSILRVSAYTQGVAGDLVETYSVHLRGPGCNDTDGMAQHLLDIRSVMGAQATAGSAAGGTCDQAGQWLIDVSVPTAAQTPVPFGLRVVEEPPIADPGVAAPSAAPKPQQLPAAADPTPVTGGAGFATATEITPGTWSSTIVPGEFNLFRFHLDYGQSARVSITAPPISQALKEKLTGSLTVPQGRLALYSPMWAELGFTDGSEFSDNIGSSITGFPRETHYFTSTPVVSASGSQESRDFDAGGEATLPGDYYVGFSASAKDYSYEFPYTLTLAVDGTVQPGPTYADGVRWTLADGLDHGVAGSSPSSSPSSTPVISSGGAGGDSGGAPTGLLVGLAVVIVAALGGGLWWWRRRSGGTTGSADGAPLP